MKDCLDQPGPRSWREHFGGGSVMMTRVESEKSTLDDAETDSTSHEHLQPDKMDVTLLHSQSPD